MPQLRCGDGEEAEQENRSRVLGLLDISEVQRLAKRQLTWTDRNCKGGRAFKPYVENGPMQSFIPDAADGGSAARSCRSRLIEGPTRDNPDLLISPFARGALDSNPKRAVLR